MKIYFAGPLFTPYERRFIDEGAAIMRTAGLDVFVPHEQSIPPEQVTAATIFHKDWEGLRPANAVVALLDGPIIDDGTACEIGLFYGLMQSDRSKKGILGVLTDSRAIRARQNVMEGKGLNLYVLGCIEEVGQVCGSVEECIPILRRWAGELEAFGSIKNQHALP